MKKILFFTLILFLNSSLVYSQFQTFVINEETDGSATHNAVSVFAADLDNDGDNDVISGSLGINNINWYRNDGQGNFSTEIVITTNSDSPKAIFAIDLDGDDLIDVLSASERDNNITWYKNLGQGVFGNQQFVSTNVSHPQAIYVIDLDGDGFVDVLSASDYDNQIAWYQNDGQGVFSSQQIISATLTEASSVYAADLDNDGDNDVIATSFADNKVVWYENDGQGGFSNENIVSTSQIEPMSTIAEDIDGDGLVDILAASSASFYEGKIAWYKNLGQGLFEDENIVSLDAFRLYSIYAKDLDNDNDADVMSASDDGKIAWYENNGSGTFGDQHVLTDDFSDHARDVFAADLNQDGKADILSATWNDNRIAWYKNALTVGTDDYELSEISSFPNPVQSIWQINSASAITKVEIYNLAGVLISVSNNTKKINLQGLKSGLYFYHIFDKKGLAAVGKLVKI